MTTIIRHVTDADWPAVLPMVARFLDDVRHPSRLVPDIAQGNLQALVNIGPGAVLLADQGGTLQGLIGALVSESFYDNQLCAMELFWYVEPGAPPSTALLLLRAYHRWAREQGAATAQLTHVVTERFPGQREKMSKLYERLGYRPFEHTWTKTLDPHDDP